MSGLDSRLSKRMFCVRRRKIRMRSGKYLRRGSCRLLGGACAGMRKQASSEGPVHSPKFQACDIYLLGLSIQKRLVRSQKVKSMVIY